MTERRRGQRVVTALMAAVLVVATGCEAVVLAGADHTRAKAELAELDRPAILQDATRAKSAAMCSAGTATPSSDAKSAYDFETIAGAAELVGSAPLDSSIVDPLGRNVVATGQILSTWSDPPWADERWDDIAVGEVTCPDGNLYVTAVVTERPTMPATGRYASRQYPLAQIEEHLALEYGTAVNYLNQPQSLLLDLYLPPSNGELRPLIIVVHGGGFANGDRSNMKSVAQDYARRGFAAATLGYRLNPTLSGQNELEAYLAAALDAMDDGMESVRWLRVNAASYGIDPDRIAMMGTSAGGGVALGVATLDDPTPGGPLAHVSRRVQAAVATGATLTLGLDSVVTGETPIMMIHYEIDTATGATDEDVLATCLRVWEFDGTCDQVILPGSGHGSPLSGSGPWWASEIGPYLWEHLDIS